MSERPSFTVEYLEPVEIEAEPLPDEFSPSRLRRSLLVFAAVVLVVVAAVVLVPGLGSLRERFMGAQPGWLVFAAVLQLGSCAAYVLVFRGVFCRRMSWRTSTEIGLSELAANSVFSVGGAGGLALGAWILRRGGLAADFIARRTVAFFLLTSLANVGFLALGGRRRWRPACCRIAELPARPDPRRGRRAGDRARARGAPAGGRARTALDARPARRAARARSATASTRRCGCCGRGDPAILVGASGYMLFDVAMLGVCFAAFGNDVPPVGVLLVAYIIGQLGSLIPIPGGIGGVDAGLIGTLVLYGVDATDAAVAVIAYRGLLLFIPAATRPAGARRPAPAAARRGARHRRLRARGVRRGARPRPRAATRARRAPGRLRSPLRTGAAGTSARPRSTSSTPRPARPSG